MSQYTTAGETLVPPLGEYRGVSDPACGAWWSGVRAGGVMTYYVAGYETEAIAFTANPGQGLFRQRRLWFSRHQRR